MPGYTDARAFFEAYAAASVPIAPETIAEFYTEHCLAAGPGFAGATTTRGQLLDALRYVRDSYAALKRDAVHVVDVSAQPLGAYHVFATVLWTASFAEVAAPIPFEVSYLLQRDGAGGPLKILAFASHEDEHALLIQHGLLPRDS